jgi:hypothetical protein
MVERVGIFAAVDSAVSRKKETAGYRALVAEGMQDILIKEIGPQLTVHGRLRAIFIGCFCDFRLETVLGTTFFVAPVPP